MVRDTAEDWKKMGETEPWYGVLSAPQFLQANINDEIKERFYAQGRSEMDWVVETLRRHFGAIEPRVGLDFGSGLGRLTFPMSLLCAEAYGLDISPGMRAEAERQAEARGFKNVTFLEALPNGFSADWINSYIVIQHILPRTGYGILQHILGTLAHDGLVSMQVTFAHDLRNRDTLLRDLNCWRFDGETLTALETREHEQGDMSMYDYDMNVVLMIFARAGVRDMFLRHTDHGGVHGFWIFGRKAHPSVASPA